jgi:TolB-like protein/Tfp pilus assembly protein PilF
MSDRRPSAQRVRFGCFEADLREGELRNQGLQIKLQERPFQVLAVLLEHAGELVTRAEMRQCLWPAGTFVDFDANLNTALNKLRQALGDPARNPRFVQTVPRRGYRFIAPVTLIDESAAVPIRALDRVTTRMPNEGTSFPRVTILVMPFENLSGDPGQDYLSDSLTDEMITRLGQGSPQHLSVIARSTAMQYKRGQKTVEQIARERHVDYVLEGSLRRQGDHVRITAQLFGAREQVSLWTEAYERNDSDLLSIQREVAERIAQSLALELLPAGRHTLTGGDPADPGAYFNYLKGLFELNRRTQEGLERSMEYFRQASEKDPEFAPPYAALAYSYVVAASWTFLSPQEAYPKAKEAAQKALTIDDTLSDAHFIAADVLHEYDWDWSRAEKEYLRGLALNPSSPVGHRYYAEYLTHAGRYPEALAEIRKAQKLDPLSLITHSLVCFVHYHAREYDTAIAECKRVLELDPNFFPARYFFGEAYSGKRLYAQAVSEHQKACDISGNVSMMSAAIACNYVAAGHRQEARKILEELLRHVKQTYVSPYALAKIYASLGDKELALAMLEKAFEQRSFELVYLRDEPQFDGLHEDPRFKQMLAQRGFPSPATALASST